MPVPENECDDALKETLEGMVRVEGGSHLITYQLTSKKYILCNHVSELGATLVCNGWRLVEVQPGEGRMLRWAFRWMWLFDGCAMMNVALMDHGSPI